MTIKVNNVVSVLLMVVGVIALMGICVVSLTGLEPAMQFAGSLFEKKTVRTHVEFAGMDIHLPQPWEADGLDRSILLNNTEHGILVWIFKGAKGITDCTRNSIETGDVRYEVVSWNIGGTATSGRRSLKKKNGINGELIDFVIEPDVLVSVYVDNGTADNRAGIEVAEEFLATQIKFKDN